MTSWSWRHQPRCPCPNGPSVRPVNPKEHNLDLLFIWIYLGMESLGRSLGIAKWISCSKYTAVNGEQFDDWDENPGCMVQAIGVAHGRFCQPRTYQLSKRVTSVKGRVTMVLHEHEALPILSRGANGSSHYERAPLEDLK